VTQQARRVKIAIGLKSHSGWAVSVAVGVDGDRFRLVDRRRIVLIEPGDSPWAKAPYHAAEQLPAAEADELVRRGMRSAEAGSERALREVIDMMRDASHELVACAVLTPSTPMPAWTTAEILAVHFRMHKAEGAMFPAALERAVRVCGIALVAIAEKQLSGEAERIFRKPSRETLIADLGRGAGPPWGADQKNAALAAMMALRTATT
jgi:hypothetical protein